MPLPTEVPTVMTLKLLGVAVILFLVSHSFGLTEPKYTDSKKTKTLHLGDSIRKTIKKRHPSFRPLNFNFFAPKIKKYFSGERRLVPMGVVGDFNGDNKKDAVVLGRTKTKYQLLAFISSSKGYRSIVHEEWSVSEFNELYVSKKKLKIYLSPALKQNLIFKDGIKRDGFHMKSMGPFIQLYYLKKRSFQAFKLGNTDLLIKN